MNRLRCSIFFLIMLFATTLSNAMDVGLVNKIADRWGKSREGVTQIFRIIESNATGGFPRVEDVLAIIAVESSFNHSAVSQGNVGLMQINLTANGSKLRDRSKSENIRVGMALLHEYNQRLRGDVRATILSYNSGITAYRRGSYRAAYWVAYKKELLWVKANATTQTPRPLDPALYVIPKGPDAEAYTYDYGLTCSRFNTWGHVWYKNSTWGIPPL